MPEYTQCEIPKINQVTLDLVKLLSKGTYEGKLSWVRYYPTYVTCYSLSLPNEGFLRLYKTLEDKFYVRYETPGEYLMIYEHHFLNLGLEPIYLRQTWTYIQRLYQNEKRVSDIVILQKCLDKIKKIKNLYAEKFV